MRESLSYFNRLRDIYLDRLELLLEEDEYFVEKISNLRVAINRTRSAYAERNSFEFCRACAERGIRCCGEGLEWKLSPEEFYINLFLCKIEGKELILKEPSPEECLFLGEGGCILILTPLFCRNFFCRELADFLGHEGLVHLQNVLQDEAELTFELCEYLKRRLSRANSL